MNNELFLKIKEDLPTLPTVVTHLLNLVLDDRSSVKDISKIISIDQTLTSKVLRVVNSAAYGLQGKISSLEHALTILGLDTLKKLFLSISIFDSLLEKDQLDKNRRGNLNKSHLWCHSLAVAIVARSIARFMNYKRLDEAYVAGLLHDIGKVIMEQSVPVQYKSYLESLHVNPTLSLQFEEKYLNVNHALVGKIVFERWNFPRSLQKAIEFHHGVKSTGETIPDLAAIISAADFICWTQAFGSFDLPSQPILDPQVEEIVNFKGLDIESILEEMKNELEVNSKIFNFYLNNPEELRKALQRANLELGRINSLYEDTKKRQERQIYELSALNTIIFKTRKVLEPSQVMKSVLAEIHEGFSFARLIWFSVDLAKGMIIPQGICGTFQNNLPITTTGCNLDEGIGPPFLTCIQSRKIVHLDIRNCTEKTPEFYLLKTMQSEEIILIPISSGEGTADLLLLDNPEKDIFISSDTIQFLDILAMNLGMALENAKLFQYTNQIAIHDSLTNIFNRRQLDFSLDTEINRSVRFQQLFSIAIFDIDHFKAINDTYGHQAGDIVLKDVAGIIKSNSRNIDIVGRFGGDEFLAILPHTPARSTFTFAERIRLIVERYGLLREKDFPHCEITLSTGVAEFDYTLDTVDRLLGKADKALYESKRKGRNLVSLSASNKADD